MVTLPKGTKEYLYVDVTDRLNNITTLDGLTLTYEVKGDEDESVTSGSALHDGMLVSCLVDTASLDPDEYDLYVIVDNPPELIRLGPHRFVVN